MNEGCWNNDHDWHGGGICSSCGTRLRCVCGAFMVERDEAWLAHFCRCRVAVRLDHTTEGP